MLGKRLWSLLAGIAPVIGMATPVQFNFSGSFYDWGPSTPPVLGLNLSGQSFSGTLLYNNDPALASPAGSTFQTQDFQTPYSLTINVNGNTISSNGYQVRETTGSMLRIDAGAGSSATNTTLSINGSASNDPTSGLYFVFFADSSNPLNTLPVIPATLTAPGYGYIYEHQVGLTENALGYTINSFGPATPAVPEPSTNAMLFSGVVLLGFIIRRSKKA